MQDMPPVIVRDPPDPAQMAIFATWTPERRLAAGLRLSEMALARRQERLARAHPDPRARRRALLIECLGYDPEAP